MTLTGFHPNTVEVNYVYGALTEKKKKITFMKFNGNIPGNNTSQITQEKCKLLKAMCRLTKVYWLGKITADRLIQH